MSVRSGSLGATRWLSLFILVLALIFGWAMYCKQITKLNTVDEVYAEIKKEVAYRFNNLDLVADTGTWFGDRKIGVPVDADGYKYRLGSQSVPSIVFALGEPEDVEDKTYRTLLVFKHEPTRVNNIPDATAAFTAVMERGGFNKIYDGEDKAFGIWSIIYQHENGLTCVRSDQGASHMTISCYTDATLQSTAAVVNKMVFAYEDSGKEIDFAEWYVGPFDIKDEELAEDGDWLTASKSEGFKLAEFFFVDGLSSSHHAFYLNDIDEQGSPNNKWWDYAGELPGNCSYYMSDPNLRAAFRDQLCVDDDGSLRRLDTDNPVE